MCRKLNFPILFVLASVLWLACGGVVRAEVPKPVTLDTDPNQPGKPQQSLGLLTEDAKVPDTGENTDVFARKSASNFSLSFLCLFVAEQNLCESVLIRV